MNELKVINTNGKFTIDSREVAEMIGKQHSHLLRDIKGYRGIIDQNPNLDSANFFIESNYINENNQMYPRYYLTRKGCDMVANKMTGEKGILFTAAYVTKFEEMEKQTKASTSLEALQQTVKVLSEHENRINQLDEKIDTQITISFNQQNEIQRTVSSRVIGLLGGKDTQGYKELRASYFAQLYRDLKDRLGVPSYRDILKNKYDDAVNYIKAWLPKVS